MPPQKFIDEMAKMAAQMREDSAVLDRALAIWQKQQTEKATRTFDDKLKGATKLLRAKPAPQKPRMMLGRFLYDVIRRGPQTYQTLTQAATEVGYVLAPNDISKAVNNLKGRRRIQWRGSHATARFWIGKTPAAPSPTEVAGNGHAKGRVFPLTIPDKLTFRERKALDGYLLHQIAAAAGGPITSDDIYASFRAVKRKATGQLVGAAVRYGVLQKGAVYTRKHKTFVAGSLPVEFRPKD